MNHKIIEGSDIEHMYRDDVLVISLLGKYEGEIYFSTESVQRTLDQDLHQEHIFLNYNCIFISQNIVLVLSFTHVEKYLCKMKFNKR